MISTSEPQTRAEDTPWYRLVDPLLQVTVVFCIFSFKIFLVSFGEAGLRPDDFLVLFSFIALLLSGRVRRTPVSTPLRLYLAYLSIEVVSAIWNASQGRVALGYSLVFVSRLLEYLAFYFIGYSLARSGFRMMRVAVAYAYLLCALVPLQMLGVLPVPGAFGRGRASGNTNGPYELAVVCGFLLCYIGYRKRRVFIGAASLVLIILTASRITLIASILSLFHFGVSRTRSVGRTIALATSVVVLGGSLYLVSSLDLVKIGALDRLKNSGSLGLAEARAVYEAAPVAKSSTDYMEGSFQDLNGLDTSDFDGDMSGLIRFTRWLTLLKANLAHADSIILGLGPSFGSAAVDGYYTRCYVETGIVGSIAFFSFLVALVLGKRGSSWYFRDFVLVMMVSALFIDVFLSYKSMLFLWLWHGMLQYRRHPSGRIAVPPAANPDARLPLHPSNTRELNYQ